MIEVNQQNAGPNHNVKITNTLFENLTKFRYLGMTLGAETLIHNEVKSSLHLGMLPTIQFSIFVFPSAV
jgi:hypothetical protein